MQYHEFISKIKQNSNLENNSAAELAAKATLTTLGERLHGKEPQHVASQLPEEMKGFISQPSREVKYSVNDFFQRVSEIEHVEYEEAKKHAKSVMMVLREAISEGEYEHIKSQLPSDYNELLNK